MLELIKRKRGLGNEDDEEMDYDGDMEEMGEDEMSEEAEEEDADDDEFVSDDDGSKEIVDSDDEKIPKVVSAKVKAINHERKESSEVSDIDPDDFSSSSEYDSDEIAVDTVENPHGFVYGQMLDTYKKSK